MNKKRLDLIHNSGSEGETINELKKKWKTRVGMAHSKVKGQKWGDRAASFYIL